MIAWACTRCGSTEKAQGVTGHQCAGCGGRDFRAVIPEAGQTRLRISDPGDGLHLSRVAADGRILEDVKLDAPA